MKSKMSVRVEFLAGTDFTYAIEEAKQKAQEWNVAYVYFDFNGRKISVSQKADLEKLAEDWKDWSNKYLVG